ncbi:MAG: hypothetical protein AAF268_06840 [Cyanobacteria bacterium P01_A01_bin.3]
MPQPTLSASQIVDDVFAGTSSAEEISFEEAFSDCPSIAAASIPVQPLEPPIVPEVTDDPAATDSVQHPPRDRHTHHTSSSPPPDPHPPQDFQMWGQVSLKFAEVLAQWRREELWRQVAPSWETFVLQHVKLSQAFVNELCELAERANGQPTSGVGELEPFIPGSVQHVAQRIRQYLQTCPKFSELSPNRRYGLDASHHIQFDLDDFRVYVWFDYVMPLDGQPHHFTRPWISNIDFQLCGEGYGEGLYSWLNISHTDIQLRQNASLSTLTAWTRWAEALQQELARSFVPSGMAVAIESPVAASNYRFN